MTSSSPPPTPPPSDDEAASGHDEPPEVDSLDFGPSGYLPERASKRARKIILRAPLGLQWVFGSVIAGIAVVIAGVLFLQRGTSEPPAPWQPLMPVEQVRASSIDDDRALLVVGAAGRVRVFATDEAIAWCAASNRLEADDGRVWTLTGRGLAGTPSLHEHPTLVVGGTVYVDLERLLEGPAPSDEPAEAAC